MWITPRKLCACVYNNRTCARGGWRGAHMGEPLIALHFTQPYPIPAYSEFAPKERLGNIGQA